VEEIGRQEKRNFTPMESLRTGLKLENTSRTNLGGVGLGLEDAVVEHTPEKKYIY